MIKAYVIGILNAELQPEVLKSVNQLTINYYCDSKSHNFIEFFL